MWRGTWRECGGTGRSSSRIDTQENALAVSPLAAGEGDAGQASRVDSKDTGKVCFVPSAA